MDFTVIPASWAPYLLSIFRIFSGLMLLEHGTAKLFKFPVVPSMAQIDLSSMPGIAGFFELIGGALLALGLFTRPVAFILSGMTAVAYFYAHAPRGFFPVLNNGELAIVYCFGLLYIAAAGGGPWAVDAARKR
ncbi:DoxX family protein [Enhydrobacter sp.]|jgi:putative oxidoreductase|uniref:DoxX family protein n=1 Tax=Enhydrobacter sp. TaxID=1894999 RepID=UPI0026343B42|nr:DoxX family protein [Enhydrobacter sp.]WIM10384.1 MAG: CDP-diacylglycerol--glycerol-3-phosphate 3-phosphatidyltransferase [Enhydrobacter sp.]